MSDTTSNLPICIHCGTPRPADESACPSCGKPWIDVQIAPPAEPVIPPIVPVVAGATAAAATPPPPASDDLAPHDTGEFGLDEWTLPPDPPKSKTIWLVPIVLLLAVGAFWAYVAFFGGSTSDTTTTTAADTTTTTSADTTTSSEPDDTTTTSEPTTTTVAAFPPPSTWPAVGDPVDQADLTLQAAGIGPISFGTPLSEAAGVLVASLGEAEVAGNDDVCVPEEQYWLQWGPLRALFDGTEPDSTFVAYKYEDIGVGTATVNLATLSGIELGDTVQQLQDTYTSYTVTFEVIDAQDYFRLLDGGDLLLWGPVTSTDADGTIIGIYSPSPCPSGT
jgi:hypothetical protein